MSHTSSRILAGLAAVLLLHATPSFAATSCEDLAKLALPNVTITLAKTVAAGAFTLPEGGGARGRGPAPQFNDLPAFCQIQATLKPTSDSDIKMEAWLPAEASWNGKLQAVGGGGGLGGPIAVPIIAADVRLGYVAVGSNSGHDGDTSYAREHPEKIKDWSYRAAHEMTVTTKALIKAHYAKPLVRSVNAQGGGPSMLPISAAQRYPADYDVIGTTGLTNHFSRSPVAQIWAWMAMHKEPGSFMNTEKLAVLHKAALDACDANDGLKDGLIQQPELCKFDPGVTLCKGADGPDCLTAPQLEAARKLYSGPINPRTKEQLYSPLWIGSEMGWPMMASSAEPFGTALNWFKDFVFKDPTWDYKTRPIDFDSDIAASDKIVDGNNIDPDLSKFFARGGKWLLVGGYADSDVPSGWGVQYYKNVVAKLGAKNVAKSTRFFMVPGMGHGPGTNGPENFNYNALSILEEWADTGKAPDQLIVTHYKNGMEVGKRLVCQYPMSAIYKGSGNTEDPASFVCK